MGSTPSTLTDSELTGPGDRARGIGVVAANSEAAQGTRNERATGWHGEGCVTQKNLVGGEFNEQLGRIALKFRGVFAVGGERNPCEGSSYI